MFYVISYGPFRNNTSFDKPDLDMFRDVTESV